MRRWFKEVKYSNGGKHKFAVSGRKTNSSCLVLLETCVIKDVICSKQRLAFRDRSFLVLPITSQIRLIKTRVQYVGKSQLGTIWEIKNLKIKSHEYSKRGFHTVIFFKKKSTSIILLRETVSVVFVQEGKYLHSDFMQLVLETVCWCLREQ